MREEDEAPMRLRRLTHEEARAEQRLAWSRMTPVERLAAAAELKERMNRLRGMDGTDREAEWTVSRVVRSRR